MKTQPCIKCLQTKTLDEFYTHPAYTLGVMKKCKACVKEYRTSPKEMAARSRRQGVYRRKHKEKCNAWSKAYRLGKGKDKYAAKEAIRAAVVQGEILAASKMKCHKCCSQADHYHHYLGYAEENRLDVVPLCIVCHRSEHGRQTYPKSA